MCLQCAATVCRICVAYFSVCIFFCRLVPLFTVSCLFFFYDTATTEIYTLSLHDALPISRAAPRRPPPGPAPPGCAGRRSSRRPGTGARGGGCPRCPRRSSPCRRG